METREYIVSLKREVNYDEFWAEMENPTSGLPFVPDRSVEIKNERPLSKKSCHYMLTDEEAAKLRKDPRVMGVEIPLTQRHDVSLGLHLIQDGNFTKTGLSAGNFQNWGLKRSISEGNNFGLSSTAPGEYEYILDGEGVDVVIMDSGIEVFHPEFMDENNETRVKLIDWYEESGRATYSTIDLSTSSNSSVSTNSYINFEREINTSISYESLLLGSSLVIGARPFFFGVQNDPAMNLLYSATENGGKSFRVRFEGKVDNADDSSATTLIWETTFFDDNKIQVLVVRHDDPTNSFWYINSRESVGTINAFKNSTGLIGGAVQKSVVLETSDSGNNWTIWGTESTDYHVEDNGMGGWNVVSGLATELGTSGMTLIDSGNFNNELYNFNTPFSFYAGTTSDSTQSPYHYLDTDGHGTHVAAILAGNTFGWAKKANIYALKVDGLEGGNGDTGTGIPIIDAFDLVKEWHTRKPVEPETGVKKPTVVNMSFGVSIFYANVTGGTYRGTPWVGGIDSSKGMIAPYHPARIPTIDSDVQEMIDEGIHVCISAGNYSHKIDVSTGTDYNNFYTTSSFPGTDFYYHRGGSPYDDEAVIVGNIDSLVYDAITDQKAESSESGPGVDIYAPGTDIISASSLVSNYSNATYYPTANDPARNFWSQVNLSGTSMASPQVAGVLALILQFRPGATPDQLKNFILANSTASLYDTGLDNDYTDHRSIKGSTPRILFNKFGVNNSFTLRFGGN